MEQLTLLSQIAQDTKIGLSSNPKYLLSKYFYDDKGSSIFQDIMHMPEYYLTDCEYEIFATHKQQLADSFFNGSKSFDLIELGAGDGLKTKVLLQFLNNNATTIKYIPIDISKKANNELVKSIKLEIPGLNVDAKTGDYFSEIKKLNGQASKRKIIFFLGSNIGNFADSEINQFLEQLSLLCNKGDKVLIGFDLKKSPAVIMSAYNDPHGHTRNFNLNLLTRLNRELNANFNLDNFEHHTDYHPINGEVKSFLVSSVEQTIDIETLGQSFHFEKFEAIFMERSRKFDIQTIENLAKRFSFRIDHNFSDKRNYFVDSLWEKA
ncbi:MAG: L-histidine N(alpha)-methyltransferase [Bacteroidales bacterium]|nr:L-histidine N(alpha)-methyltransferase [Bacteroidales bacterium]